ncbi:hypothetical protein B0H17DRAFT_1324250 [Mycena rosella]|uniref:C2H2-type domain-containing protein n=1 Tax=Mycena rosella TaxID=1033263 RepID=A0AAD7H2P6_MYCRO|nr:hypothetical protein B0H17DRAFT_1324250 [Mycena rosella]
MSLTLAPTGASDDEPTAAFILETTKASFLPLSPLTDIQSESRRHATHVPDDSLSQVVYPFAGLAHSASYVYEQYFTNELGARSVPQDVYYTSGSWAVPLQDVYEPTSSRNIGVWSAYPNGPEDVETPFDHATLDRTLAKMQPDALADLLETIMETASWQSSLPSPPSRVASMNAGVALQLFQSASHAIPAQVPAYSTAPFYHPSGPQYAHQRSDIPHRRPMPPPVVTHNMWMFSGYPDCPSESTSGSSSPVMSLDPMRHYRDRDSTPVSRLASPDVPPVAGPSKPYGRREAIQEEKRKKARNGRQDRRHNPLPAFQLEDSLGGTVCAQSSRCSAVGTLEPNGIEELVNKAWKAQRTANVSVTFVCQWKGCGMTVNVPELRSHLGTEHKSHHAVACEWGTCTETLTKGAIVKHLFSGKHLGAVLESLKCEHCDKGFAGRYPLRRHLQGTK